MTGVDVHSFARERDNGGIQLLVLAWDGTAAYSVRLRRRVGSGYAAASLHADRTRIVAAGMCHCGNSSGSWTMGLNTSRKRHPVSGLRGSGVTASCGGGVMRSGESAFIPRG